jgi:hypothetical protein
MYMFVVLCVVYMYNVMYIVAARRLCSLGQAVE